MAKLAAWMQRASPVWIKILQKWPIYNSIIKTKSKPQPYIQYKMRMTVQVWHATMTFLMWWCALCAFRRLECYVNLDVNVSNINMRFPFALVKIRWKIGMQTKKALSYHFSGACLVSKLFQIDFTCFVLNNLRMESIIFSFLLRC